MLHVMSKVKNPDTTVREKKSPRGQRVGYRRVSSFDQNENRQLDGVEVDRAFLDKASGKDTNRPELKNLMAFVREGDTVVCHSMDRLGRNLDDLRKIVVDLTGRGVRVEFIKENLIFTGEDSPMANLLLSVIGAISQFERELIRERQREGIAIAKRAGVYSGGAFSLSAARADELRKRVIAGEKKAALAREFGVDRTTVYRYIGRAAAKRSSPETVGK
jgi:DNA invertase Pin-like site-specific DNA recombinase